MLFEILAFVEPVLNTQKRPRLDAEIQSTAMELLVGGTRAESRDDATYENAEADH